jgi:hypothetical protein
MTMQSLMSFAFRLRIREPKDVIQALAHDSQSTSHAEVLSGVRPSPPTSEIDCAADRALGPLLGQHAAKMTPTFRAYYMRDSLALGVPADPRRSTWPILNDARSETVAPPMPTSSVFMRVIRCAHCLIIS